MALPKANRSYQPRELRRRVVLPARLRLGSSWGDACILNISSGGLMIQARRGAEIGSLIELRRGEHAILARVVWRQGTRAGLRAEERLPIDDILTLKQVPALQLTAGNERVERRKRPPTHDDSRWRARAIEFGSIVVVAASLGVAGNLMVEQVLARPIELIDAALGG